MANQGVSVCWCVQIYKGRPFRKVEKTKSSKKAARASIFSCALASPSLSIFRGDVGGGGWYGWRAVTYLRARPASAERKRWLPRRRARHLLQAERPTKKKKREKQSSNNKLTQFWTFFLYCTQIQTTAYKQTQICALKS